MKIKVSNKDGKQVYVYAKIMGVTPNLIVLFKSKSGDFYMRSIDLFGEDAIPIDDGYAMTLIKEDGFMINYRDNKVYDY